jgi:cation diffusion facilitator family transporter
MSNAKTSHILQSLLVNVAIAVAKGIAAALTGSGALLAEAIHSTADCANQVLLLVGVRAAARPPTKEYPLGRGREAYFWSFLVAQLLFSMGGIFSIYEGVHKFMAPEPVQRFWLGLGILVFSICLEGGATISNIREVNHRRKSRSFFRYLRATKDSDLIVVLGENSAAVVGLTFAMVALTASYLTGDSRWDAAGSIGIGVVLVVVAIFLAVEIKSLLLGERADEEIEKAVRALVRPDGPITEILSLITLQQGPGEVVLATKVRIASSLAGDDVARAINQFEQAVHDRCPEVRWLFVEPDIEA